MTFALRTAQAKVLMTAASSLPVAIPAAKNAGISQDRIILLEGRKDGFTSIQDLVVLGGSFGPSGQIQPFKIPPGQTNKDICGFLSFSRGTTGLPKAVGSLHHSKPFAHPSDRSPGHDCTSQRDRTKHAGRADNFEREQKGPGSAAIIPQYVDPRF